MKKEINLAPLWQIPGKAGYDRDKEESCKAAVQAVLDEEQARCHTRIVTVRQIYGMLQQVEETLQISKKALDGTTVHCDPFAQRFPQSYRGIPMTTVFQARYSNGSWRLTDICRVRCAPGKGITISLSPSARDAVLARMSFID